LLNKIFTDVVIAFIIKVITSFLRLFLSVIIARSLGASDTGVYFLALSIAMFSSEVSRIGIDHIIVRFCAIFRKNENFPNIKGIMLLGLKWCAVFGLLATLIIVSLSNFISFNIFNNESLLTPLIIMSFGILTFSLMKIISEGFKGLNLIPQSVILSDTLYLFISIFLIPPSILLFGLNGPSVVFVISTLLAASIGFLFWNNIPKIKNHSYSKLYANEFQSIAKPLWLMSIIDKGIFPWFPIIILGFFFESAEVGIFSSAFRISVILTFFLGSANAVLAPRFSELFFEKKNDQIEQLAQISSFVILIFTLIIFVITFFNSSYLMSLFGEEFISGSISLRILLLGQVINALCGSVGIILTMSGNEEYAKKASFFGAFSIVILSFILIPKYAMIGAAIASTLGISFTNFLSYYYVVKKINIYPTYNFNTLKNVYKK